MTTRDDAPEWAAVNDFFHRALAEPPASRRTWLIAACGSNAALLAEVESLLSAHEMSGEFLDSAAVPSAARAPDSDGELPAQLGPYRILRVLGRGGMGIVYLAEDARLGRTVALKALPPASTDDESRRERLRREARAAASIAHPGVATVFALEEIDGHLYIASEYVAGETLREEIVRGPLPARRVLETARDIARALDEAHGRGLVHRDLKPENLIRTPGGGVKILDFGLASQRVAASGAARLTAEHVVPGTPDYMSPEQIRGETAIDGRADLFSLGIVLFELAACAHPFGASGTASTVAAILEAEPMPLVLAGDAPEPATSWLQRIVNRSLQKDPARRYQTAGELADAVERALTAIDAGTPVPRNAVPGEDPRWWWQFHQGAASAAYIALLVPLWFVRGWIGGAAGLLLFLAGLTAVIVASTLRLHLWFAARSLPGEWRTQHRTAGRWIRLGDWLFVAALVLASVLTLVAHQTVGIILLAAAVAVALSAALIEPATTRAAFPEHRAPRH